MNWLQKVGAVTALVILTTPVGLETMPIAIFQSFGGLTLWYATGLALIGLVGWSLPDEDEK